MACCRTYSTPLGEDRTRDADDSDLDDRGCCTPFDRYGALDSRLHTCGEELQWNGRWWYGFGAYEALSGGFC